MEWCGEYRRHWYSPELEFLLQSSLDIRFERKAFHPGLTALARQFIEAERSSDGEIEALHHAAHRHRDQAVGQAACAV